MADIFRLSNVDGLLYILFSLVISLNSVEYETEKQKVDCSEACLMERRCVCSKCRYILITGLRSDWIRFKMYYSCCSNCTATCTTCPLEKKLDANQVVNGILGLGGEKFK